MKFPSGIQRLLQGLHPSIVSFDNFKILIKLAALFGLVWFVSLWVKIPEEINFIGTIGTVTLIIIAAAELAVLCIERLAVKLNHESNYYWAGLVLITVVLSNQHPQYIDTVLLLSAILLVRWMVVVLLQTLRPTKN